MCDTQAPQGLLAVCRAARPSPRRRPRDRSPRLLVRPDQRPRPRQRRHRDPRRGRGRRRRGARQRRQRRRLQPQGRALDRRVAVPPAGRDGAAHRADASRPCARAGVRLLAADGAGTDAAARRRPRAAARLGHGQRGLGPANRRCGTPATRSSGCRSTAGRVAQPRDGRHGLPLRLGEPPQRPLAESAGCVATMAVGPWVTPGGHGPRSRRRRRAASCIPDGLIVADADAADPLRQRAGRADPRRCRPSELIGTDIREAVAPAGQRRPVLVEVHRPVAAAWPSAPGTARSCSCCRRRGEVLVTAKLPPPRPQPAGDRVIIVHARRRGPPPRRGQPARR